MRTLDYVVTFPENLSPAQWDSLSVTVDNLREARRIGDPLITNAIIDYLRSRGATVTPIRRKTHKPVPAVVRRARALHR